ncbi:MAG: acetylxylan esterase [Kineosporiaceae bacterium]
MAQYDLSGEALRGHRVLSPDPVGLREFWDDTLSAARAHPVAPTLTRVETPWRLLDTFDVSFAGFGGQRVKAWLSVPAGANGPLPTVVEFVGYGGGRGLAHEVSHFALAGWAHLRMDTRGQGSNWSVGDTPDEGPGAVQYPGFVTRGVDSPQHLYYRRAFTDAVRAVEAAQALPVVDAARVAVAGGSQGGAFSVAAAALGGGVVAAAVDVPFLADIRRAVTICDEHPYREVVEYLHAHRDQVDGVLHALDHVDVARLAPRATCPALFSVALMDPVCPPSTVYAAYNAWGGPKEIAEYPFNQHEGGGGFQERRRLAFLRAHLES